MIWLVVRLCAKFNFRTFYTLELIVVVVVDDDDELLHAK